MTLKDIAKEAGVSISTVSRIINGNSSNAASKEMQDKIRQYYCDKEFYNIMQDKAKERVKLLLDTEGEFTRIVNEVYKREKQK